MTKLLFIFGVSIALIFTSCSSEKTNENISDSDIEFKFEIVDSLTVDYLGMPFLCDFSPSKERVLLFNSRNTEFIITDSEGEIISQFTKEGDIPDNPGILADKPIFYDNQTVIARGLKGVFAYDFTGENIWKISTEENPDLWLGRLSERSMYLLSPSKYFTIINYDDLAVNPSNDSLYENHQILKIMNKESRKSKPVISLETFGRFLDGKGYPAISMLPTIHKRENKLLVSYKRDKLIYLYEWENLSFHLKDTFSLTVSPFYLDEPKERESFKDNSSFIILEKIHQGKIKGAWLLDNDLILVQYNIGIKESERLKPKIEKTGMNELTNTNQNEMPPDQFQLFRNGKKYGEPLEARLAFSHVEYVKDNAIWFKKDNEALNIEDDYAVFYKAKLVEKR
ncbi:hypothetical protein [Marivirga sp.]|uniref:hypothetical protein n=1 Tax=Marivirga sp. TaxID=2018662 RepID=UPI002D80AE5D|nr:hypothetical protein [Marivirga sp.]HET8860989.1 hypothetical protein [Marivirga sp.]